LEVKVRNASVAEWIVRRFTSKERAASIVGDFIEQESQKGAMWFWLSITGVLLSLSWRRVIALFAVLYASGWTYAQFQVVLFGIPSRHRPMDLWLQAMLMLAFIGFLLWMILIYGAISYGLRDRATQMAFLWTVLMTSIILFWLKPSILAACLGLGLILAWSSMSNRENRRAMLVLTATTVTGVVSGFIAAYAGGRYQNFVYPLPLGPKELAGHPSIVWVHVCLLLIVVANTTTVYSRMHARTTQNSLAENS
jgi:hypothetical protein